MPVSDPAEVSLAEAAVSVSHSLHQLSRIRRAEAPRSKKLVNADKYSYIPGIISVDWSGPVEPLLKKLAAVPNYHLRVIGNKPSIPVIVTINATNVKIADLLRDIDFQVSNQADVRVYTRAHQIELRYRNV